MVNRCRSYPVVNIGLVPMVSMLVRPPLIFPGVTVVSRYVDGRRASMRTVRAGCHEGRYREEIQLEDWVDPVSLRETRRPASSNGTIGSLMSAVESRGRRGNEDGRPMRDGNRKYHSGGSQQKRRAT